MERERRNNEGGKGGAGMKILLIKGGKSLEHNISLKSAQTVRETLENMGHEVTDLLLPSSGEIPLTLFQGDYDIAYPVMHGRLGEDGCIQGLLELIGKPYVSERVFTSSIGMNKLKQHEILHYSDIPLVPTIGLKRGRGEDERMLLEDFTKQFSEFIVKINGGGSSIGVFSCDRDSLEDAVEEAFTYDDTVLVQKKITPLRELECLVVKDRDGRILTAGPLEVIADKPYTDYSNKYSSAVTHVIEAKDNENLSHETVDTLHSLAARAFDALDGSLYMRIDFFMDGDGMIYLNEVNTIPGSTPTSHFNILARELGGFGAVLNIMLESALARHEREKDLRRLYG